MHPFVADRAGTAAVLNSRLRNGPVAESWDLSGTNARAVSHTASHEVAN